LRNAGRQRRAAVRAPRSKEKRGLAEASPQQGDCRPHPIDAAAPRVHCATPRQEVQRPEKSIVKDDWWCVLKICDNKISLQGAPECALPSDHGIPPESALVDLRLSGKGR
jgi:hypothetical protein